MIGLLDPEGTEKKVLHDLVDFKGKDVIEVGCGDGRMTWLYADDAASVFAFDPDESSIATARDEMPERLNTIVEFRVADTMDIDLPDGIYDVGLLSWSI